jgi:hypothetical protein
MTPYEPQMAGYEPRNDKSWRSHSNSINIKRRMPSGVWSTYFKFTFERNPWDRVVSNFWFRGRGRGRGRGRRSIAIRKRIREDPIATFSDWLRKFDFSINRLIYTDEHRNILVDFVGRYERLQEDFSIACDKIGLTGVQELPFLKAGYRKDKRHYSEYYKDDPELIDIIATEYEWEIKTFGYEFEEQ